MKLIVILGLLGIQLSFTFCHAEFHNQPGFPPQIVDYSNHIYRVQRGSTLKIKCPIQGSKPFSIEWYKGKERIDGTTWLHHSISGKSRQFLKIQKVGLSDSTVGQILCKGVNGFGSIMFEFDIQVKSRYEIGNSGTELMRNSLRDTNVKEGDSFSLTCAVKNPGDINVRWLKMLDQTKDMITRSDIKLEDDSYYRHLKAVPGSRVRLKETKSYASGDIIGMYTLEIANSTRKDSGIFTCLVINSLVKLDKTFSYSKAKVLVTKKTETTIVSTSATDTDSRMGKLTITLIVLPVILVILLVILLCVMKNNSKSIKRNSNSDLNNCSKQKVSLLPSESFTGMVIEKEKRSQPQLSSKEVNHTQIQNEMSTILGQPRVYHLPGRPIADPNFAGIHDRSFRNQHRWQKKKKSNPIPSNLDMHSTNFRYSSSHNNSSSSALSHQSKPLYEEIPQSRPMPNSYKYSRKKKKHSSDPYGLTSFERNRLSKTNMVTPTPLSRENSVTSCRTRIPSPPPPSVAHSYTN